GAAKLPRAGPGNRIVECDDETRGSGGVQARLDHLPWLEIVGQRDGAEIVAKRRPDTRCNGQHGGNSGHDGQVQGAPFLWSALDGLAYGGRHGEHAGIAPRDDSDAVSCRSLFQRLLGTRQLLAVVGGYGVLVTTEGESVDIGLVAIEELRIRNGASSLGRDLVGAAGA